MTASSAQNAPHPVDVAADAEGDAGRRLDQILTARLDGLSRSRIQALIKTGAVTSGGATISEAGYRVKPGEVFTVAVPAPEPAAPAAQAIALDILFEDKHLIVVNKPAGMVVHPAPGNADGTLVNALIAHCGDSLSGIGGVRRPGIVHRLDKDTSGVLVVAKSDAAHHGLSEQFSAHGSDGRLTRAYLALVWGKPDQVRGEIDAPLARSMTDRKKIAVTRAKTGRRAVTHYEIAEVFADAGGKALASLLRLELETGRTHQIRVHLTHIGHPVLGDQVYGAGFKTSRSKLSLAAQDAFDQLGRQALHATLLGFEHPATGKALRFESPLPDDMARLLAALRAPKAASAPAKSRRR